MENDVSLSALKEAYRIPAAWRDLGLQGQPGKTCLSPFREEKSPSFSVFDDGKRFRDFGSDEAGTVIDFIAKVGDCDTATAIGFIKERLGIAPVSIMPETKPPAKWPDIRPGNTRRAGAIV